MYEDNPYMNDRLSYYVRTFLPKTLKNENTKRNEHVQKTIAITEEQDVFYKSFLHSHPYYYLSNVQTFYEYRNNTYTTISEDILHFDLLSNIGANATLVAQKQKIKQNIINRIKERHLFNSIPESSTIQSVLRFLQNILFETKGEAKYFLTVLGDSLLKKETDVIFVLDTNVKRVLSELNSGQPSGLMYMSSIFVTRFHETHVLDKYRILYSKKNITVSDFDIEELHRMHINIMCVAAHYSGRSQNSEAFLMSNIDDETKSRILYVVSHSQNDIIQQFIDHSIEKVKNENEKLQSISWNKMHYLWKQYIAQHRIPNIMYTHTLKEKLINILPFAESNDKFINIISKYTPQISAFLDIWKKHMKYEIGVCNEYEINEIAWILKNKCGLSMGEQKILSILGHFFPPTTASIVIDKLDRREQGYGIIISNDKYIQNIVCDLWDKKTPIRNAINDYKKNHDISNPLDFQIIIDDMYNHYLSKMNESKANEKCSGEILSACSKGYFQKYVRNTYFEDIFKH